MITLLVAAPIGFWALLRHNRKDLESVRGKIGTLYTGIDTKRKAAMFYSPVFFIRRLMYAAVAGMVGTFDGGLCLVLVVTINEAYTLYLLVV